MTDDPRNTRQATLADNGHADDQEVLAHGVSGGDLILLPLDDMENLARIFTLLESVQTVGDYVRLLGNPDDPEDPDNELIPPNGDVDVPMPPETPFSIGMVPGADDGYFPPNIGTCVLDSLEAGPLNEDSPHCILDLCNYYDYMGSQPRVEIPAANREQVFERLTEAGYTLVERQDLVDQLW